MCGALQSLAELSRRRSVRTRQLVGRSTWETAHITNAGELSKKQSARRWQGGKEGGREGRKEREREEPSSARRLPAVVLLRCRVIEIGARNAHRTHLHVGIETLELQPKEGTEGKREGERERGHSRNEWSLSPQALARPRPPYSCSRCTSAAQGHWRRNATPDLILAAWR